MAFEYLYHVSNVFFLISYVSWHDIVLRGSLALAFTFLLIWSILTNTDYLAYVIWNSLFIAINCIHLFRLFYQRRPIRLTPLEEEAFRYCFQQFGSLTRSEFCDVCAFVASLDHRRAQLWRCGVDRTYEDGETIAAEGSSSTSLGFLVRGKVQKVHDNRVLHTIIRTRAEDWVFLFSLEYVHQQHWYQTMPLHLTRRAADSGTTVHTWSLDTLARLYRTNPALRSKILVLLSIDLVRKLQRIDEKVSAFAPPLDGTGVSVGAPTTSSASTVPGSPALAPAPFPIPALAPASATAPDDDAHSTDAPSTSVVSASPSTLRERAPPAPAPLSAWPWVARAAAEGSGGETRMAVTRAYSLPGWPMGPRSHLATSTTAEDEYRELYGQMVWDGLLQSTLLARPADSSPPAAATPSASLSVAPDAAPAFAAAPWLAEGSAQTTPLGEPAGTTATALPPSTPIPPPPRDVDADPRVATESHLLPACAPAGAQVSACTGTQVPAASEHISPATAPAAAAKAQLSRTTEAAV